MVWSNALLPLAGLLYLLAYFWGWGSVLLRLLPLRLGRDRTHPLLVLALGLCAAILAILVLGFAGLLRRSIFILLSATIIAVGSCLHPPWQALRRGQGGRARGQWTLWQALLETLVAGVFVLVAGLSLLPDESWDALAYHLPLIKIYVQQGRISYIPWLFHSNLAINGELVFLHGFLLDGDRLVLPLNLVFYATAATAVFEIARLELSRGPALLAMLVFMLSPEVCSWVNTSNVEIAWTAFATVSLWCALRWQQVSRPRSSSPISPVLDAPGGVAPARNIPAMPASARRAGGADLSPKLATNFGGGTPETGGSADGWLYLAGLFAGFAAGTKAVGGVLSGVAVGLIILGGSVDRRRIAAALRPALKYTAVFVLAASPIYLKSYVHTGTPFWPQSLGIFSVRNYDSELWERCLAFTRAIWGGVPLTPSNFFLAAWDQRHDPTVALLIVFAVASLVRWRRFPKVAPLVVFAAVHYAFWCYGTHQTRFLIPALPAAIVGLMELTYGPSQLLASRVLSALFWLVALAPSLQPWAMKYERFRTAVLPVVSGSIHRDDLLRSNPLYVASRLVDRFTDPDAKILLFQEMRGYYLDRDNMWGDPLTQGVLRYSDCANAEQLREAMRKLGITHLLVGRYDFLFPVEREYARSDWDRIEELLAASRPVFATHDHVLYSLDRRRFRLTDPESTLVCSTTSAALVEDGVADGSVAVDASGYPFCRSD